MQATRCCTGVYQNTRGLSSPVGNLHGRLYTAEKSKSATLSTHLGIAGDCLLCGFGAGIYSKNPEALQKELPRRLPFSEKMSPKRVI